MILLSCVSKSKIINNMSPKNSPDTLGSSLNLLGFCMVVLTSVHLTNTSKNSLIDEITSILSIILAATALLSFVSMRFDNPKLEKHADRLFIASIIGVFVVIFYITIVFWQSGEVPL